MPRPARVWLVRHAETATPMVFHGAESDVGLSELGNRQAAAAAEWFRECAPTVVVSSAMQRAVITATAIAQANHVPHVIAPELHERKVGALCGTSFTQAEGPWAETLQRWQAGETAYTTPGAESYDDLRSRLRPAFQRVVDAYPDGRVAIIAHGVVCKVLLLSLLPGKSAADWLNLGRVANLAVSELTPTEAGWRAETLLVVPPPVAALSDGFPTGVGHPIQKSEA